MILPAAINSLAAFAHPAPSRIDMVLAARAASTDADRARDAALARYVEEHGDAAKASGRSRRRRRCAASRRRRRRSSASKRSSPNMTRSSPASATWPTGSAILSPAYLTYQAMADIAGSGETRYRAFLDRIRAFHVDWREFFLSRAKAGASLTAQDYDAMPNFTQANEERWRRRRRFAGPLIGVALPALLLAIFAWRGFRRCDRHVALEPAMMRRRASPVASQPKWRHVRRQISDQRPPTRAFIPGGKQ